MGIAAMTLGITGIFACIFPPLGIPISFIGLILSIVALVKKDEHRRATITGLITCIVGLILNIVVIAFGFVFMGMMEEFMEMYPNYY